jgi:hypothetical protein
VIQAPAPPWRRADWRYLAVLVALAVTLWLPRLRGPLDLRYDAGVYYILATSLAEGRGYRLLNEPGAIEAIQYPPVLPAVGAAAERVLGTDDPAVVGHWLRLGSVLLYAGYAAAVYGMSRRLLTPGYAFLVAALSVIHSHTIFLSDFFAADVPYAFVSSLFFAVGAGPVAGLLAVTAYGVRTAGIALLGTWVADSLIRRRLGQAAVRSAVAGVAVLAWMGYTARVKADEGYTRPAYTYQRAGYQFYNVSYAENMSYVDPFRPELGRVTGPEMLERVLTNVRGMPKTLGEGVSVHRGWWRGEVDKINQRLPAARVPMWVTDAALLALCVPVVLGFVLLALQGAFLVVLYAVGSLVIIAVTPWPIQFVRYMVPLTPFLTLALVSVLAWSARNAAATRAIGWRALRVVMLGTVAVIVAQQVLTLARSITKHPTPAVYTDRAGQRHEYRLFFYDRSWRLHDEGLDWLGRQARPGEIVATSTPHWAYLRTGLPAVMPPYEADARLAATLLDRVPATYLIVDQLSFLDVGRRYTIPAIERAPDRWRLIYAANDSGPRIYRRVDGTAK